jgi:superfamily II DNA or RNA helicase
MDKFVKKISSQSEEPPSESKPKLAKRKVKKIVSVDLIQTTKETVLGAKGYSILKSDFSEDEIASLKKELIAKPASQGGFSIAAVPKKFPIFRESGSRLYMPRYFGETKFGTAKRMRVGQGDIIDVPFQGSLRDNQIPVVETYIAHVTRNDIQGGGGLLELPCAYGKTTLSLYICSKLKVKTLVIVHKEFLLNQWVERIQQFLPTARIGRIQGSTIDTEDKDIVLGMLQSLSMKDYPDSTFSSFGLTIIDEVHHISSEVFSCALFKIVSKYMLGLSATMNRKDGTTKVFKMFLGDVVYKGERDQEHDVIVRGIQYRVDDDEFSHIITNFRGDVMHSSMISKLCAYSRRSEFILRVLIDMLAENPNQQIMILAHNKSLLTYLHDAIHSRNIASVGYYIGGMKEAALKESEDKKVIIATYAMASEALDIKTLTTLIMATPKTDIEQSVGRILRQRHTNPIVVDIIDQHDMFIRQWYKRRTFYKKHNYKIFQTTSQKYTPDTSSWVSVSDSSSKGRGRPKKSDGGVNVAKKIDCRPSVLQTMLTGDKCSEEDSDDHWSNNTEEDESFTSARTAANNAVFSECLIQLN